MLWKEKQERKEKEKKRVEEISQDEKEKIREGTLVKEHLDKLNSILMELVTLMSR